MSVRRAFEEKVVEAVLRAAMESEALYTMLLGAPAISRFMWRPDFALAEELQRTGILEQATHENTGNWLANLLRREKFAPPTARLPMDLPFSAQGPQPFIFRLYPGFSNIRARLSDAQSANNFQICSHYTKPVSTCAFRSFSPPCENSCAIQNDLQAAAGLRGSSRATQCHC